VGGFEKVYELGKVFRNEGVDRNHNPEFTILETMEAYISYKENMDLVEEMLATVCQEVMGTTKVIFQDQEIDFKTPWKRITMREAVREATGVDFSKLDLEEALVRAEGLGLQLDKYQKSSVGLILASVFEEKVEPTLIQPTFVYEFPVETSPLAKRCPEDPRFVERFEHFVAGMEASNNYSELNDPLEITGRFEDERKKERLGDEETQQTDNDFIEALEYGMPPTSGIGPGVDRFVMVLANASNVREVVLFPTMRPRNLLVSEYPDEQQAAGDKDLSSPNLPEASKAPTLSREDILELLNRHLSNKNLIKHCLATEAVMGALYDYLQSKGRGPAESRDEWSLTGLIHDVDYEATKEDDYKNHGLLGAGWVADKITSLMVRAIAAHNAEKTGVSPQSDLDWCLRSGETATGLLVAAALVLPSKKLADLSVDSIVKRFKEKSFAKGVRREVIRECSKVGLSLEEFVEVCLKAMRSISEELGL